MTNTALKLDQFATLHLLNAQSDLLRAVSSETEWLTAVHTAVRRVAPNAEVAVALLDGDELVFRATTSAFDKLRLRRITVGQAMHQISSDDEELTFPLWSEGRMIGLVVIATSDHDVSLFLETLSHAIALSLAAFRHKWQVRRYALEIETYASELARQNLFRQLLECVASVTAERSSEREALQSSVFRICELMGWSLAHVVLVDNERTLATESWYPRDQAAFSAFCAATEANLINGEHRLAARVLAANSPICNSDIGAEFGIKAAWALPIHVGSEIAAILEFYSISAWDADPQMLGVLGSVGAQLGRVMERKRADQKLRMSETRNRLIVDTANDAFVVVDCEGRVQEWNRQAERLFGWTRAEVLGLSIFDKIAAAGHEQSYLRGFASRDAQRIETVARERLGKSFPVEISFSPVASGKESFCGAFIRDIRERKKAEEAIRMREEQIWHANALLTTVVETAPYCLCLKDARTLRYVLVNGAAETLLGVPREKLLGKTDYDLIPLAGADERRVQELRALGSGELVEIPEQKWAVAGGETRLMKVRHFPVRSHSGDFHYLCTVAEDITAQKAAEAELVEQRKFVTYAAKMSTLGEMAGGIAHEINNPLSIILGYGERMQDMLAEGRLDVAEVAKATEKINKTAARISGVVKGLRFFARDAKGEPLQCNALAPIVDDTLALCRERFTNHGVPLTVTMIELDLSLLCHPVQISQVLLNLLNNAFDAVSSLPEKWIRLEIIRVGSMIEISVVDSGSGISQELQERIFNPFFTTKEVGKGTGLGLSISKGIIESHGGHIEIDRKSANTRFIIRLPEKEGLES